MKAHNFKTERPTLTRESIYEIVTSAESETDIEDIDEDLIAKLFFDNYNDSEEVLTELIKWHHYEYSDDLRWSLEKIECLLNNKLSELTKIWITLEVPEAELLGEGTRVSAKHGRDIISGTILSNRTKYYYNEGKYVIHQDNSTSPGDPVVKMEDIYLL